MHTHFFYTIWKILHFKGLIGNIKKMFLYKIKLYYNKYKITIINSLELQKCSIT